MKITIYGWSTRAADPGNGTEKFGVEIDFAACYCQWGKSTRCTRPAARGQL
jgi:hypothetical protein